MVEVGVALSSRRTRSGVVSLLAVLVATLLPGHPAVAAPSIAFVNPSGYTTPPPTISDVQDEDGAVHLVAWSRETPSEAVVEFELQPAGGNAVTFGADRVGSDTWEALAPIPDAYPDASTYTLRARLYSGPPGNAQEVATAEMVVDVNQSDVPPPGGQSVELSYPDNGGRLGIFTPKGKAAVAVFDYVASAGTQQVRALYTLAEPGSGPVTWEEPCGISVPGAQGVGRVRCTLSGGHDPLDLTAVAVVSNRTSPPAPPSPALDDAGDAHRVTPYAQRPEAIEVAPSNVTVELGTCHLMTASVRDQFDRPVAVANLDVHAQGPQDELYFATRGDGTGPNDTDPYQAPDEHHGSREETHRCTDLQEGSRQGDHNSPGRPDTKHIESTVGTSTTGSFRFALRSEVAGGTFVQVWADSDDDDEPDLEEASGGTQLGWGTPPPPPSVDVFLTQGDVHAREGSCVAVEVLVRRSGAPFSNANVDIHLQGPNPEVTFCEVAGGAPTRPPESGPHVGSVHDDGTRHAEGETGSNGRLTFGVTSASSGETQVQVWSDITEDDTLDGEPARVGTVTWVPPGARTISISSSRSRVPKGRPVRLSGDVDGDPDCTGGHTVRIQSRPADGGRFRTVKTVTTSEDGVYATRVRMQATRRFRALAPGVQACSSARSRTITVRVS